MRAFVFWFIRALMWVGHRTRIYATWSRLWRFYENLRYDWPFPEPMSPEQCAEFMRETRHIWTPDSWWRLFDSISPPGRWTARANGYHIKHSTDCDEASVDCAAALRRYVEKREFDELELVGEVHLLQVFYAQHTEVPARNFFVRFVQHLLGNWRIGAHHVCLFRWLPSRQNVRRPPDGPERWAAGELWWHLSNWGLRGPFTSPRRAAMSISGVNRGGKLVTAWTADPASLGDWRRVQTGFRTSGSLYLR